MGNIPCSFEWETDGNNSKRRENIKYNFVPSRGVVPPKSRMPIKFIFSPQKGGVLDELFVLNCERQKYPLGFELRA